jgi:hypothetical protein
MAGMKDHKLPELSIWKLTNNEGIEFSIWKQNPGSKSDLFQVLNRNNHLHKWDDKSAGMSQKAS